MQIAVLGAALCLLVAWTVVGLRMLLLARRTRGVPELTLGLGLFLISAVGYPMTVISSAPVFSDEARFAMNAAGTVISNTGMASLFVFTWRVFRPEARWAAVLFLVFLGLATLHTFGWLDASWGATSPEEILARGLPWAFVQLGMSGFCFGWAGVESLRHWPAARRRQRLGLADPTVVNRFLLWGLMGAGAAATSLFDMALIAWGTQWTQTLLPLVTSLAGVLTSVLLWLAFFPPKAYLRWVRSATAPA